MVNLFQLLLLFLLFFLPSMIENEARFKTVSIHAKISIMTFSKSISHIFLFIHIYYV